MATSTEKVWQLVEYLADQEDAELREAVPWVPPTVLRTGLAMAGTQLPDTADGLDQFLTNVATFCMSLRSDELQTEPAALVEPLWAGGELPQGGTAADA